MYLSIFPWSTDRLTDLWDYPHKIGAGQTQPTVSTTWFTHYSSQCSGKAGSIPVGEHIGGGETWL